MAQELGGELVMALRDRYVAQRSKARVNLKNYMFNAVGVGEHANIVDEVDKLVRQIDLANSLIETVSSLGYGSVNKDA